MSYSGLGLTTFTGVNLPTTIPTVTSDPNAWRKTVKDQSIALANAASAGTGRAWSPFVTKLVKIYAMALTATPQAILAEIPVEPFYTGSWNSSWPGDLFSKAKIGVAAIRALVERAAAPPPPPPPPTFQIFGGGITPTLTNKTGSGGSPPPPPPPDPMTSYTPPPVETVSTPVEVQCPPGHVRSPDGSRCQLDTTNPYAADIATIQAANPGMSYAEASRIALEAREGGGMLIGPPSPPPLITPNGGSSNGTLLPSSGPLGVSWRTWGIGAAVVVGAYAASRMLKANRRRVRRNRRRR